MHLDPTDEGVRRLLARRISGPVTMLNLLRFREWADYSSHPELAPSEPVTGREAYDRYIRHTLPFLAESGGSVQFIGTGGPAFVGPADERWDLVMLVRQASVQDFFAFAGNEAYLAGAGHRTAALEDSRLVPVVEESPRPVISLMLAVPDAPAAVAWYQRAFGATVLWDLGSVVGLEVEGAPFLVGQPENNGWESPSRLGTTSVRVEVFTDDPDAFVARAVEAGADGARDPVRVHTMPWGPHRQGGFFDPFGHLWLVGDRSPLRRAPTG